MNHVYILLCLLGYTQRVVPSRVVEARQLIAKTHVQKSDTIVYLSLNNANSFVS